MLTGNELRQRFIDYFVQKRGHAHLPSSSLIPDNPTVLMTTAGMLQFVPIFLGYQDPPSPPRVTTYQKCARAGGKDSDIENVGRTPRHHTFFEMLGNFSFGDYFKEEIIPWSWEFVTEDIGLDAEKCWVTVYHDDDESYEIWNKKVMVPEERILRCGKKDNFWGPPGPTGPCGPCTEIHYDLGEDLKCDHPECKPSTCECDRWVEIWNLVLMEMFLDEEGNYTPLEKKNVDTGMGLERMAMVCQNKRSTFETDLLQPIMDKVCALTGKQYKLDKKTDVSLRIITDHARCVTFMVSDGLKPGNVGRNYVLRMILRRALRHGKILGVDGTFLHTIVDTVIDLYKGPYPEIADNRDKIIKTIKEEEERFARTIDRGMGLLNKVIDKTKEAKETQISGTDAFTLYDTYGFPCELTVEIAEENGLTVDLKGFEQNMKEQKERAKQAHVAESLTDDLVYAEIQKNKGATTFTGYDETSTEGCQVIEIIKEGAAVEKAEPGDLVEIILDKTPFYGESGGQIGDEGTLSASDVIVDVVNTAKFEELFIHKCEVREGEVTTGLSVSAQVDAKRRKDIARHHTATHLIHSALKKVLGDDVNQAGSMVAADRARFDFSYPKALKFGQLKEIEKWVNIWINDALSHKTEVMKPEQAKSAGAIALFGEKYADEVRVVSYGEISKELCGGTHIQNTGEIHLCKIIGETALAAGIRRLEAVCGSYALDLVNQYEKQVHSLCGTLKVPAEELTERIDKILEEARAADKKIQQLNAEIALSKVDNLVSSAKQLGQFKLLSERIDNLDGKALKAAAEKLSDKIGDSVVVLGSAEEETSKVTIVVKVSDSLVKQGYKAGEIASKVAAACGGRGGGKPNFAQAGAKDPSKLNEALNSVEEVVMAVAKA